MKINIADSIRADARLADSVSLASELLRSQAPPSGVQATADWRLRFDDRHQPVIDLSLRDATGDAETHFVPDELDNPRQTTSRLIRLWGDLLQDRSQKQIAAFATSKATLDGEEALDRIADELYSYSERTGSEPKELRLPVRHAVALMKLGPSFWGADFQQIREKGIRGLENQPLFGVPIKVVSGVEAEIQIS